MSRLGFSLYPEGHDFEEIKAYIDRFRPYQCQRVFLSLLQISPDDIDTLMSYRQIAQYCQSLGLEVFADLNPGFIQALGWEANLMEEAHRFGLRGIRLDESFDDAQIAALTHHPLGIKIELNMSTEPTLLRRLVGLGADLSRITACHNFYPHQFTGLSTSYFLEISRAYREFDVETAAFINAQSATTGPWPVSEGLCTLEEHRSKSLNAQYKWLLATGLIDHIIIANQFVSSTELTSISQTDALEFDVQLTEEVTEVERAILAENHVYRGDISEYVIRSTGHRSQYATAKISPRRQDKLVHRGAILIDNQLYTRYCGELQLALRDFQIGEKTNIVGRIVDEDLALLNLLQPWQGFRLNIVTASDRRDHVNE